ncbi:MAG: hypothetical protein JO262_07685 [Solirubrobacterales bacterium]|nr:hypothetical protein [Solirubrobacterales bacterium]
MTWQVGAFLILALALAGGFAWYERAHPDARIVALVGTLAAFAALGRIAFAAVPNVKPTTDIVLVSGYALGGGPGFAVGALGGLASNFFFGQGPWTPWQMAGWGLVGVIGAALAVVSRHRIGRWPLALVCAAVGFAFTALQDLGDWVTYSDHSLVALGVYVGKGIGFDCVHAAGCLLFALALGPALIRSLSRFATRLQVTWRTPDASSGRAGLALLLMALPLGWLAGQPGGGPSVARAAATPTGYLLAAQNADGGFGPSPGSASSQLYSGWVALGLAAAGENLQGVARGGYDLLDYVRGGAASASDPGSIARTILVARAAGASATDFGGRNLVGALERDIRTNGSVANQVNLTAFALLALRAAGVGPPAAALPWLARQQDADGGFNFATRGGTSDVDDTGAALQALAGAGGPASARARSRAVRFLRAQQRDDGGFPSLPGADSNAQSTAFAVQGLIAGGVDPGSLRQRGASPLDYLRSLIAGDGHVRYSRTTDQTPTWVTAEALLALEAKPLPLAPVTRRHAPAVHRAPPRPATARRASAAPRSTDRPAQTRPAAARRAVAHRTQGAELDRLAVDAGLLTALSLAPLGQG